MVGRIDLAEEAVCTGIQKVFMSQGTLYSDIEPGYSSVDEIPGTSIFGM